jgi:hypothetical protein
MFSKKSEPPSANKDATPSIPATPGQTIAHEVDRGGNRINQGQDRQGNDITADAAPHAQGAVVEPPGYRANPGGPILVDPKKSTIGPLPVPGRDPGLAVPGQGGEKNLLEPQGGVQNPVMAQTGKPTGNKPSEKFDKSPHVGEPPAR